MNTAQELATKLNLNDYFSQESLEKLLSADTQQKASQMQNMKDVKKLLEELNLPELPKQPIVIDDGPELINQNPGWGPCFGEDPVIPLDKRIDTDAFKLAVADYESYRFSPKAPGHKSSRNSTSEGAKLGAFVGAGLAAAAGKYGALAGLGAAGVAGAVGGAIVIGAAAGAAGVQLGKYLKGD